MINYQPFFESIERQQMLFNEMESWVGVPWRHRSRSKGGCDCIGFVVAILEKVGVWEKGQVKIPLYQRDWHIHSGKELLYNSALEAPNLIELNSSEQTRNGDVLLFHFGKAASHVGIWYESGVYHAITSLSVRRSPCVNGAWAKCLKFRFRPMEEMS
jgi:cell wall-associated NlpC family hydrolase